MQKNRNLFINKNSSVFIATFSHYEKGKRLPTNGMIDPLLDFFLLKVKEIVLVDQPHPVSDSIDPVVEVYTDGSLKKRFLIKWWSYFPIYLFCKIPSKNHTRVSYKFRDLFSVFYTAFCIKRQYDLFIGLESINTISGIVLKKLGYVKTVVYYVSDYAPNRYPSKLFNGLYLWLDRFCVRNADFTWDVSPAIKAARLKAGLLPKYAGRILHVPNGLFPSQIAPLPISKRTRDSILFVGIFDPELGIDLLVKAFEVVKTKRPHATLHIIGGMEDEIFQMKQLAKKLGIEESIVFYGYQPSNEKMSEIVKKCYIGVAPYRTYKSSRRRYGDSGKIRIYLGCGLPIVSTYLLWHTKYAIRMGAGIRTKDTVKDLATSILTLLQNDDLYKKCSEKAIELSKKNIWENAYSNALVAMHELKESL